jgi:predicted NUDIX family NTP pyrophosphohydrolase
MASRNAGLLLYRRRPHGLEVLLVHPGGPFWAKKDLGAWTIPKGQCEQSETLEAGARREFTEETGFPAEGAVLSLGEIRQAGGKRVHGFALEGDLDSEAIRSNEVTIVWPPRSGRLMSVPEVDRASWFGLEQAARKMNPAQCPFLDRLGGLLPEGGRTK